MEIIQKIEKIEILMDNKVKIWFSNHTMNGNITVAYSEGQDLIESGDNDKAKKWELTELTDDLWSSKKVVKKSKK
tara:strand:- start:460 stop:684 length:225 start_codon:yes stop_codon:yes gene_type:complete